VRKLAACLRLDTQSFPPDVPLQTKAAADCGTPRGASSVQNFDSGS